MPRIERTQKVRSTDHWSFSTFADMVCKAEEWSKKHKVSTKLRAWTPSESAIEQTMRLLDCPKDFAITILRAAKAASK